MINIIQEVGGKGRQEQHEKWLEPESNYSP
jgi:hypothetical protein